MLAALALLAATCAALRLDADVLEQYYTPTPQGYVLRHCVHSVCRGLDSVNRNVWLRAATLSSSNK